MFSIKKTLVFSLVVGLVLSGCGPNEEDYKSDVPLSDRIDAQEAMNTEESATKNDLQATETELENEPLPEAINWDVPFFAQAPFAIWDPPYGETCEEASIVQAYHYLSDQTLSVDEFDQMLLNLVDWQNETYGNDLAYEHSTVEQTAYMLEEFFDYTDYEILEDPSVDDLKTKLAKGALIVAPFAGRELENPFFSGEGPLYHMFVMKGYNDKEGKFITNDVGTRHGQNFTYSYQNVMDSMSDWPVTEPEKRVLVMY